MAAIYKSDEYMGDLKQTEIWEESIFNGDYVRHVKPASAKIYWYKGTWSGQSMRYTINSRCIHDVWYNVIITYEYYTFI